MKRCCLFVSLSLQIDDMRRYRMPLRIMAINIGLFLPTLVTGGCAHPSTTIADARSPVPTGCILWFERDTEAGYAWSFFLYLPDGA